MMKKSAMIFYGLLLVVMSGVGWSAGKGIEKFLPVHYEAKLPLQLADEQPNQAVIDQLRYALLYKNKTVQQLSKQFEHTQEVIAGNLNLRMAADKRHFQLIFTDSNREVAEKVVREAEKKLQGKKILFKKSGKISSFSFSKSVGKVPRIGAVVGFFVEVGFLGFAVYRRKKNSLLRKLF